MQKKTFPIIFGRKGGARFDILNEFKSLEIEKTIETLLIKKNRIEVLMK